MFPALIHPGGKLNPRFAHFSWTALADYEPPFLLFGSNGNAYVCLQASGPGTTAGAKDPTAGANSAYWGNLKTSAPAQAGEIANKGYVDGAVEAIPAPPDISGKLDASAYAADAAMRIVAAADILPTGVIVWAHGVTSCTRTQTGQYKVYSPYANIANIGFLAFSYVSTGNVGWHATRDMRAETSGGGYVYIQLLDPAGTPRDAEFTVIFIDGGSA